MKKYFLVIKNEKIGPLSIDEINQQEISSETLVWAEGFDNWKRIKEVEELENLLIVQPPPIPNKSNDMYQVEAKIIKEKKDSSKAKKYFAKEIVYFFKIFGIAIIATILVFYYYQLVYIQPNKLIVKTLKEGTNEEKLNVFSKSSYWNYTDTDCEHEYISQIKLHLKDYPTEHWINWRCKNEIPDKPFLTNTVSLFIMSFRVMAYYESELSTYEYKQENTSRVVFFILLIGLLLIRYAIAFVKWLIINLK